MSPFNEIIEIYGDIMNKRQENNSEEEKQSILNFWKNFLEVKKIKVLRIILHSLLSNIVVNYNYCNNE